MDWQLLIQKLRDDRKMRLVDIANAVGAPLSTISDLARGATVEPRGGIAMALIDLQAGAALRRKPA